jgi:hypothetical protein
MINALDTVRARMPGSSAHVDRCTELTTRWVATVAKLADLLHPALDAKATSDGWYADLVRMLWLDLVPATSTERLNVTSHINDVP